MNNHDTSKYSGIDREKLEEVAKRNTSNLPRATLQEPITPTQLLSCLEPEECDGRPCNCEPYDPAHVTPGTPKPKCEHKGSCPPNCTRKHTHKTFYCDLCEPEECEHRWFFDYDRFKITGECFEFCMECDKSRISSKPGCYDWCPQCNPPKPKCECKCHTPDEFSPGAMIPCNCTCNGLNGSKPSRIDEIRARSVEDSYYNNTRLVIKDTKYLLDKLDKSNSDFKMFEQTYDMAIKENTRYRKALKKIIEWGEEDAPSCFTSDVIIETKKVTKIAHQTLKDIKDE